MQTLDQQYADCVRKQVLKIKKEYENKKEQEADYKKYGAMAHKLPILIYTAGLVQALEFVNTRDSIHRRLLGDLAQTIGQPDVEALLAASRGPSLSAYMLLTQRTLAALLWYKRFAQSILDVDASE